MFCIYEEPSGDHNTRNTGLKGEAVEEFTEVMAEERSKVIGDRLWLLKINDYSPLITSKHYLNSFQWEI